MRIDGKVVKSEVARAMLIKSYDYMVQEFKIPQSKQLTRSEIAKMSNGALYRASKDVYNNANIEQVNKLAVKMGLKEKPVSWITRILRKVKYATNK